MKLSRKFLNDYLDIEDKSLREIADQMTNIGNEYASCSKLIPATNLVIGKVIECVMHPDSNHLHVCKVDIKNEILQIVCGAPNVREGIKVIVAKVGAILPEITIKKSNIRGVESNGMLCALFELGLDKKYLKQSDVDGICILGDDAQIGEDPIKYLGFDDEVIDFELTSNRGDLLSILGMSYEIGAIYNRKVKDIDLSYTKTKGKMNFNLQIETSKCPLFLAKKIQNITIKESPNFIKERLIASGIRPINNIVDISNFVMLETGQPLHFYDLDRLGNTLIVRDAKENEKLTTLDGNLRTLNTNDIVIANQDGAVGLAGVMGGLSTEVEQDTKNILIESAIFDSISVRLTSKKILRSEASNRFEKGLDPKRTYMALERCCNLLEKYADATIIDDFKEYNNLKIEDKIIEITTQEINNLLGTNISEAKIISIFENLDFKVLKEKNILKVTVPTRRLDISIKEDLIEEVARLNGLQNLEGTVPTLPLKSGSYNKLIRLVRNKMVNLGLNETLSYTLIPQSEVHKYTTDKFTEINVLDPMSDDRKTLRYSLLPSLMMIYDYNSKRSNKDICIFEIGKSFSEGNLETKKLACLMTGNYTNGLNKEKVNFYHLKGILESLLDYLGFNNRYTLEIKELPKELHPKSSANIILNGEDIGLIGKIHPNISKEDIFVFEINLSLIEKYHAKRQEYIEFSKYPNILKDVAFVVSKDVLNADIIKTIKQSGGKLLTNIELFDLYVGDKIDQDKKSMAYTLTFNDSKKTLTDEEVMNLFNKIIESVTKKYNCVVRDK